MQRERNDLDARDRYNFSIGLETIIGGLIVLLISFVAPAYDDMTLFFYLGSGLVVLGAAMCSYSRRRISKRKR